MTDPASPVDVLPPSEASPLTIAAPAKINRMLRVLGRREDGFHDLETEFVALDWCDTLQVAPRGDDIALTVDGPLRDGVPTGEANLVVRALQAWRERAGHRGGFAVRLTKAIPNQAGLGGGSSDAAAALVAADRLAGQPLGTIALHEIAAGLGSDLNFFVAVHQEGIDRGRGRGRGEQIDPQPSLDRVWVIAKPPVGLSTAAVFANLSGGDPPEAVSDDPNSDPNSDLQNDLQPAAEAALPELARWRTELERATGTAWMLSGSGTAYWCEQPSRELAESVAAAAIGEGRLVRVAGRFGLAG